MSGPEQILNYAPQPRSLRQYCLEEHEGRLGLTFPCRPKWAYVLDVAAPATAGMFFFAPPILLLAMEYRLRASGALSLADDWLVLAIWLPPGLCAAFAAAYKFRMYRRWGRVPRVLTADKLELTDTRLGIWSMRRRTWPAGEIARIEVRRARLPFRRWHLIGRICVIRRDGKKMTIRIMSKNLDFSQRLAERLATALQCQLKDLSR
jgi:hypothetical protein